MRLRTPIAIRRKLRKQEYSTHFLSTPLTINTIRSSLPDICALSGKITMYPLLLFASLVFGNTLPFSPFRNFTILGSTLAVPNTTTTLTLWTPIQSDATTTSSTQSSSSLTTSTPSPEPSPLTCDVNRPGYTYVPGFSVCNGNWAISDFCSANTAGYKPLVNGRLTHTRRYYPLHLHHGIFLSLQWMHDAENCDFLSKRPESPEHCEGDCDPWCISILTDIMNDCK